MAGPGKTQNNAGDDAKEEIGPQYQKHRTSQEEQLFPYPQNP